MATRVTRKDIGDFYGTKSIFVLERFLKTISKWELCVPIATAYEEKEAAAMLNVYREAHPRNRYRVVLYARVEG